MGKNVCVQQQQHKNEKNYRNVLFAAVIIYGFGIAMPDQRTDRNEEKKSPAKLSAAQCPDTRSHNLINNDINVFRQNICNCILFMSEI